MGTTTWAKQLRYRLEQVALLALAAAVPRLSRGGCARVADWLGRLAFAADRRGRGVALENIGLVFGDALDPAARRRVARRSYELLARTALDLFWVPRLTPATVHRHVRFERFDLTACNDGRGGIFVIPHLAGFEWAPVAVALAGHVGTGVAEPFKNPLLEPIFGRLRSTGGVTVLAQEGAILRLFRHLKRGGRVGMLVDLSLPPDESSVVIESFGRLRCVPAVAAALHLRTGAPVFATIPETLPDGSYQLGFAGPLELGGERSVAAVAQRTWDFFEPLIRRRPEAWLWAYKHWRHRPAGAAVPYPSYAAESKKFEALRRRQAG